MNFSYRAYRELLMLLRNQGYAFQNYHTWQESSRCVILRHDIDESLEQALRLAELEAEEGIQSTYFVLLRTDFYNPSSQRSQEMLHRILAFGHELGLHFDEVAYGRTLGEDEIKENIIKECEILSDLLETPITTVSMHRPSRATLDANLEIPGIVNSYGKTFFHDFKYLSDSRHHWREPALDIIRSGEYDRLHILTHAFWYHQQDESISEAIGSFVRNASQERYARMEENMTDLQSVLRKEEI